MRYDGVSLLFWNCSWFSTCWLPRGLVAAAFSKRFWSQLCTWCLVRNCDQPQLGETYHGNIMGISWEYHDDIFFGPPRFFTEADLWPVVTQKSMWLWCGSQPPKSQPTGEGFTHLWYCRQKCWIFSAALLWPLGHGNWWGHGSAAISKAIGSRIHPQIYHGCFKPSKYGWFIYCFTNIGDQKPWHWWPKTTKNHGSCTSFWSTVTSNNANVDLIQRAACSSCPQSLEIRASKRSRDWKENVNNVNPQMS